jgi:hypothetical protein
MMTEPEALMSMILKTAGAFGGAVSSILFFPPKNRSEFWRRMGVSVVFGIIFASTARDWWGWAKDAEGIVAGACFAAVVAWWGLGAIQRISGSWKPK